jgi:hypothetical protein
MIASNWTRDSLPFGADQLGADRTNVHVRVHGRGSALGAGWAIDDAVISDAAAPPVGGALGFGPFRR